jgi:ATP-dependent helicase/nuclease subunit B
VQVKFLIGPAGSGKTFRCLQEVRVELLARSEEAPLVFLAPKQATFQLERQLLLDGELEGYTRLQILSFERLAQFALESLGIRSKTKLLDDEGRLMVLRALLRSHQNQLRLFRASARLPGFAQQLSLLFRELQRYKQNPAELNRLADSIGADSPLGRKLHDLGLLLGAYLKWLSERDLQDANCILDIAAESIRRAVLESRHGGSTPPTERDDPANIELERLNLAGLWLDGFAEMTPQELDLLAALTPLCRRATLAFCLDREPVNGMSWLSIWSLIGQTFRQCYQRLSAEDGIETQLEVLSRNSDKGRFRDSPMLYHLESYWACPKAFAHKIPADAGDGAREPSDSGIIIGDSTEAVKKDQSIRIFSCPDQESESVLAAHEIIRYVRERQGRYREVAVLVRELEGYYHTIRRIFTRYEIPYFLDRREPVSHHPLAELTRGAFRLVAYGWRHDDWFGMLKSGLAPASADEIAELENAALANGWQGQAWRQPLSIPGDIGLTRRMEALRRKLVPTLLDFEQSLRGVSKRYTGSQLQSATLKLWGGLKIPERLARLGEASIYGFQSSNINATVWEQMQSWLENLEVAFSQHALTLREWLPILEAGLASLSVGVIPPALDQVLVGAIDRSRNPDLKLTILLGMNEAVFPATPVLSSLLTERDRDEMEMHDTHLGPGMLAQIGRERFLGYIACTRSSSRLVLTYAQQSEDASPLNPSPFVPHLQTLFPALEIETFNRRIHWCQAEHARELVAPVIQLQRCEASLENSPISKLENWPMMQAIGRSYQDLSQHQQENSLAPAIAAALYGPKLRSSVSSLEQFAACPFKFFVRFGLAVEERERFEIDARRSGSFQHEVLQRFHERLEKEGRKWRDCAVDEGRALIAEICQDLAAHYQGGLFMADGRSRFEVRRLSRILERFIEVILTWTAQYEFDPVAAELAFGRLGSPLPAWEIKLGAGKSLTFRGIIDRVDLWRHPEKSEAWVVVMDYKSSERKLDPVLMRHGIQLQLLAYLSFLRQTPSAPALFRVNRLIPAGVFFVNLRGTQKVAANRDVVLKQEPSSFNKAYQHTGRFIEAAIPRLDNRNANAGDQFKYRRTTNGKIHGACHEVLRDVELATVLDEIEAQLHDMGDQIFAGVAEVDPYKKGLSTACERCEYRGICRIDIWTHSFRCLS